MAETLSTINPEISKKQVAKVPRHNRLIGLDVLRAAAILMVVLYHWPRPDSWVWFRALAHFGWIGVDLFFVLSGYLIAGQFFPSLNMGEQNSPVLFRFYARRFLRTLPNYYVILGVTLIVLMYSRQLPQGVSITKFLFFIQNFGVPSIFTISWSLCIEEHFYLLFPLLALAVYKSGSATLFKGLLFVVGLTGILLRSWLWLHYSPDKASDPSTAWGIYLGRIYYPTYTRLDGLMVGIGIAALRQFKICTWNRLVRNAGRLFIIGIALLAVTLTISAKQFSFIACVFTFPLLAVSFGLILIAATSQEFWLGKHAIPAVKFISVLSYSIYLTHGFAFSMTFFPFSKRNEITLNLLWLVLVLLFACLLHYGVERPFLRLRDRLFAIRRAANASAGERWVRVRELTPRTTSQ